MTQDRYCLLSVGHCDECSNPLRDLDAYALLVHLSLSLSLSLSLGVCRSLSNEVLPDVHKLITNLEYVKP